MPVTPKVVLARTRFEYGSYTYFWKLAGLSGLPVVWVDEIDPSEEAVYVVTPLNGEFSVNWDYAAPMRSRLDAAGGRRKARLVWWNLERPGGEMLRELSLAPAIMRDEVTNGLRLFDAVWACDRYIASMDPRVVHVTVGSHPDFREGGPLRPYAYDLCHFSYVNGRRAHVYAEVSRKFRIASPDWTPERPQIWNSVRAILNVHQSQVPGGEQIRFAAAAAYGVPILSESMADPFPLEHGKHLLDAPYGELPGAVEQWLTQPTETLLEMGRQLHDLLTREITFRSAIEEGARTTLARLS